MTSADTITVIAQSAPDVTGPLVGIVGVALGSLLGLAGLRWQQKANVMHDIRKNVAELLVNGQTIWLAFDSVANPARGENTHEVADTAKAARRMRELVAYIELVAEVKTFRACEYFRTTCETMQAVHAMKVADPAAEFHPGWDQNVFEWVDAKKQIHTEVQASRPPRRPLLQRLRSKLLLRSYERMRKANYARQRV